MVPRQSLRQRAWGTDTVRMVNPTPLDGRLTVRHSEHHEVQLRCSRGSNILNRRRGSLFTATSNAYKPPTLWFSAITGRGGGEVVPVRSPGFAWRWRLPAIAADTLKPQDMPLSQADTRTRIGFSSLNEEKQKNTTATSKVERKVGDSKTSEAKARKVGGSEAKEEAAGPRKLLTAPPSRGRKPAGHKRSVTWSGTVETKEVERMTSCDIFSPDLLSLEVAKQLADLKDDPELARAVEAVTFARKNAACVIRSLSARHDWNGSLDGVEEACRVWTSKEGAYLRELDELVRCVVSIGGSSEGRHAGDVWGLKAIYREARRKMEDAETD